MSLEDRILDTSKRFAREVKQAKGGVAEERVSMAKSLQAERESLAEELRQRQQQVQLERSALGHDRSRARVLAADVDDEVLVLNCGGDLFSAKRSTLCLYEGSYLANLFSGRWDSSIERDSSGHFFIDFDPACFRLVLNFLRSKRLENSARPAPAPAVPPEREEQFRNLVEYFGLTAELQEAASAALRCAPGPPGEAAPAGAEHMGSSLLQSASALLGALRGGRAARGAGAAEAPDEPRRGHAESRAAWLAASAPRPASAGAPPPAGGAAPAAARGLPARVAAASGAAASAAAAAAPPAAAAALAAAAPLAPAAPLAAVFPAAAPKRPGWSAKGSHRLATTDEGEPCLLHIAETRALACAAAARATRGFRGGRRSWHVDVELCSDWSYVGFVGEPWTAVSCPVGRAPFSWGLASNGALYAGREEVGRAQGFSAGSRVAYVVDMGSRSATVIVDGVEFPEVFRGIPAPIFPAASNCRSPARYMLAYREDTEEHAEPPPGALPDEGANELQSMS